MERSVVLVKPDGLQRAVVGEIIHRFERKGLQLLAIKMVSLDDSLLEQWYIHHKEMPFFSALKAYMKSYPVVAMLWGGKNSISTIRKMIGITKSRDAEPGTIRGDYAMSQQYNLIHASENSNFAKKEENLMFNKKEIFNWEKTDIKHVYLANE
jgi:nucleoside-diphosphate kinase